MLANLWMLKAPNGMFWYAVDYLRRLESPMQVVVRPRLLEVARRELAGRGIEVRSVGTAGFLCRMALAGIRREFVYVPTPHPLPLLPRQLVTFHDAFPFEGPKGRLKLALFRFGVCTARSKVAYINRSAALPFLLAHGIPPSRLLFAPNMPPLAGGGEPRRDDRPPPKGPLRLGAFGTDSPKKRYGDLLAALSRPGFRDRFCLCIFGEENDYTAMLLARFPRAPVEIVDPKRTSLPDFIASLDACISIASGEGFGRPLATAIATGVPCYLVNSPTFREFFAGPAVLDDCVDYLLQAALERGAARVQAEAEGGGFLSADYKRSIESAISSLSEMAGAKEQRVHGS